jgi:hypothetical protein
MSVAGIQVGAGISFGAGIGLGNSSPSFTITSADISNPSNYYNGYSNLSTNGFTSDGTQLYNGVYYEITTLLYLSLIHI